jgi:hypothetical protein
MIFLYRQLKKRQYLRLSMKNIPVKIPVNKTIIRFTPCHIGARGGVVVKALRYKPEGRGFDSRCCHWIFPMT